MSRNAGTSRGSSARVDTPSNVPEIDRGAESPQPSEQQVRLALALVALVGEKGYQATTVADMIERAGISRKAFYSQFANKQECLLVTFDLVAAEATRRIWRAYREASGWPERAEAAIHALFISAIENPGALRLSLFEISAAGSPGIERRERSIQRYENLIRDALELAPGKGEVSDTVLKAVVGGLYGVLYRRVPLGDDDGLLALVPDLVAWATSYYPTPPAILAEARRAPSPASQGLNGGRAPGTLAPHTLRSTRRGLPRGDHNVSRSFVVHSQRERILDAVTNLTAADGYAALKVEAIAASAAVSFNAFYEHFDGKEDALLVAYELGYNKGLAIVERAYAAESDWRLGTRAGIAALLEFLASEPSFAHLALIEALTATPRTAERSAAGVSALARMLVPEAREAPGKKAPPSVTIEAIAAGVFELCRHYALQGRIAELPGLLAPATYIALAPFLGAREAAAISTTGR